MSAFIVGDYHLNYIISAIGRNEISKKENGMYTSDELVELLLNQNVRSVNARYSKADIIEASPFRHNDEAEPVQALKACACLEYQSCETEDYRDTEAFRVLDAIRDALIRKLPGYQEGEWEVTEAARDLRHKQIKLRILRGVR